MEILMVRRVLVFRRRAVVGGEERLCVGVHSLTRVQEQLVAPICSISWCVYSDCVAALFRAGAAPP